MRWISANQLETWAQSVGSRNDLAKLVSDLLRATADDITAIRFPSGDKGQVRGFDGHLESASAYLNVPKGRSYWEFGTSEDYKAKAQIDFDTRTREVARSDQLDATLVLATPWTWDSSDPNNKIEDWITARKKESSWKDIHMIDGSALEIWLEHCPAVSAWHAANTLRVRPIDDIRSTDEFWRDYSGQFGPAITEEVLLCERDAEAKLVLDGLMQPNNSVACLADSQDEVIAFAVAAIRRSSPEVRLFFEARTLVIDSISAGRHLLGNKRLVLLLRNDATRSPGQFTAIGSILVALTRTQRVGASITLNRPTGYAMGKAMTSMGLDENESLTLARGSGRSLTALARLRPGGSYEEPGWVAQGSALLPAILAGAWDSSNPLDQEIVKQISGGTSCGQIETRIRGLLSDPDPPFDLEGSIWKVRAPMDAFMRVGFLIGGQEAALLRKAMIAVFGHIAPEVDPEDIVIAPREPASGHSEWLREGLATTLLLLAVWSDPGRVNLGGESGQTFANRVLKDLPGLTTNYRLLTSLRSELPMLAEAAPDPLLSALEQMLGGEGDLIRPIFDEKDGLLFPTSKHTGVLWALETLAWDPDYFRRSVLALARLAVIDPGGRLSNRPSKSLSEIFLLWNPQTNASSAQRLSALDEIARMAPDVGWKLTTSLLPTYYGVSTPTAKPQLREAGASERKPVTYRELGELQSAVLQRALRLADHDVDRWIKLISGMGAFPALERASAIPLLDTLLATLADAERNRVWAKLRDEVARHERFNSAQWALNSAALAPMKDLVERYAPPDPVLQVAWLFETWTLDDTGDLSASNQRRTETLKQLYTVGGIDSLFALGMATTMPHLVVEAMSAAQVGEAEARHMLERSFDHTPDSPFSFGLMGLYRQLAGPSKASEWLMNAQVSRNISNTLIAKLLLAWPDDLSTWRIVGHFGPEILAEFWKQRPPRYVSGTRMSLLRSLLTLLRFGRASAALASSTNRLSDVPTLLLLRMLDTLVPELNSNAVTPDTMLTYHVERTLSALDGRADASNGDVAQREYALLPLLEFGDRKLRLHDLMASDPAFYHGILRAVFRSKSEPKADVDEATQGRARLNYSLLSHFEKLPGETDSGIDEARLTAWIDEVRRLGTETDRAEITDDYVGKVLAHAPRDGDGGWPHRVVRDQIERLASDVIEQAIQIERFNMRGAHGRALFEGGKQERELASDNVASAQVAIAWPRSSAMLRAMARSWEEDAKRVDLEAAQRKLRS